MVENPLQSLIDHYEAEVAENDAAGFANEFKRFTEYLLYTAFPRDLNRPYDKPKLTFTPADIKYLDGYFLFGRGTNSIVHFHLKEAPGWLFGLWYKIEVTKNEDGQIVNCLAFDLFAQYELFIDKFKPTASTFLYQGGQCDYHFGQEFDCSVWDGCGMLRFIIREPALAFCRDVRFWDYNEDYHSRKEAQCLMAKDIAEEKERMNFNSKKNQEFVDFIKSLSPRFRVIDYGKNFNPRYIIAVEADEEYKCHISDIADVSGDTELIDWCGQIMRKREKLHHEGTSLGICYWCDVSDWLHFLTPDQLKQRDADLA